MTTLTETPPLDLPDDMKVAAAVSFIHEQLNTTVGRNVLSFKEVQNMLLDVLIILEPTEVPSCGTS